MDKLIRLTPSQRKRCNRLIRKLCANYDEGNCLLLDDGETCVCPQTISFSLLCKYFRRAVLPADKALYADINNERTMLCVNCGQAFVPNSNRQKYCSVCARSKNAAVWTDKGLKAPLYQGFLRPKRGNTSKCIRHPVFGFLTVHTKMKGEK